MARTSTPARSGINAFSMLGGDTTITGNIEASADLHIDGRIDGDIACSALVLGEDSAVTGSVRAESVRVAGTVKGLVAAREVVVLKSARIVGDISYDALTVEQGARLEGRLIPNGGQEPPAIASAQEAEAQSEDLLALQAG